MPVVETTIAKLTRNYTVPHMSHKPSALLLIATGCQHCPTMLQHLSDLIKEGKLSSLEVVNIVEAPERAQALNVRSVPWLKLGELELTGMKTRGELQSWIDKAQQQVESLPEDSPNELADKQLANISSYFEELMTSGEISKVEQQIVETPAKMPALLSIIPNKQSGLSAKIGVGAILESLAESPKGRMLLANQIDTLGKLCKNDSPQVRNDACYYLGLTHSDKATPYIKPLLEDTNEDVIEAAKEALTTLDDTDH